METDEGSFSQSWIGQFVDLILQNIPTNSQSLKSNATSKKWQIFFYLKDDIAFHILIVEHIILFAMSGSVILFRSIR